jgi:hypothetical protein
MGDHIDLFLLVAGQTSWHQGAGALDPLGKKSESVVLSQQPDECVVPQASVRDPFPAEIPDLASELNVIDAQVPLVIGEAAPKPSFPHEVVVEAPLPLALSPQTHHSHVPNPHDSMP